MASTLGGRAFEPGKSIPVGSLPNLRDIGGYPVASGGKVRLGTLYRSVELSRLGEDDLGAFSRLGVRTVFDLRTEAERAAAPDILPEQVRTVVCDVLGESADAAPAQMMEVAADPARAAEMFGDGKALELFEGAYRQIVSSPGALRAYRRFFDGIAVAENRPALFHCTTGKDRTGWAAASTLLLLGVDEEHVFHDYELTNRDLLPAFGPLFEQFERDGGDPSILKPVLGVDPAYLRAALAEMRQRFGSIDGYFEKGLGIDAKGRGQLRSALTVDGRSHRG